MAFDEPVGRVGHTDEVGGGEGGDDGDSHDDGVNLGVEYPEAHTEGGDDEGELADLGQGEA